MLHRITNTLAITLLTLTIGACSHATKHPQDPYEGFNREMYGFNKTVDKAIIKPIAYVYLVYLPLPIQSVIGNFFNNLREITNVANDVLQAKFAFAAHDTSRFVINSTLGIGGLFDPASSLGLEMRKVDFGQTLYVWGYKNSAYLVLPFIGPSTVRDGLGLGVDYFAFSVWPWIDKDLRYILLGIDYIDLRARMLARETVLDAVAVDEYSFIRDAYFQHRQYLITTGNENEENLNEEVNPYEDAPTTIKSESVVQTTKTPQQNTTTTVKTTAIPINTTTVQATPTADNAAVSENPVVVPKSPVSVEF